MEPRRATPLIVADDIEGRLGAFLDLGFERVETGTPGVVSLRAGNSFVVIASPGAMARFQPATIARLQQGRPLLVHVPDLAAALERLPKTAEIVEIVVFAPFEAVVQVGDDLLLLTLRVPGQRWEGHATPQAQFVH